MIRRALLLCMLVLACGDDIEAARDGGASDSGLLDGSIPDASIELDAGPDACASDLACQNGSFCDGIERCAPGSSGSDVRGCVSATTPRCLASQRCVEASTSCVSSCVDAPDADADGHDWIGCGGDDCDDANSEIHLGATELCDALHADEDCDPSTIGVDGDGDGDGVTAGTCCNVDGEGTELCGTDCDDEDGDAHPGARERCNGADDDCDGVADEGPDPNRDCAPDHALGACVDGACSVVMCEPSHRDCDGAATNGCETDVLARDATCGSCTTPCSSGSRCVGGTCRSATAASFTVRDVSAGPRHTCATLDSGVVYCWGANHDGQLGDATFVDRVRPVRMVGIFDAVAVAAGGSDGTSAPAAASCVVLAGGTVRCAGDSLALGNFLSPTFGTPDDVYMLAGALDTEIGGNSISIHTCALRTTGSIACWGDGGDGQLGQGTTGGTAVPVESLVSNAIAVTAGGDHSCAIVGASASATTGSVWCWGGNRSGQLGRGTTTPTTSGTPMAVGMLPTVRQADAGTNATCAVLLDGTTRCWGNGPLGDGTMGSSAVPLTVVGLTDAVEVVVGTGHMCARRAVGTVTCWGTSGAGRLGDGGPSGVSRLTPTTSVVGLSDAIRLSAGVAHTCAVRATGDLVCWGLGVYGQLGDGAMMNRSTPVPVAF